MPPQITLAVGLTASVYASDVFHVTKAMTTAAGTSLWVWVSPFLKIAVSARQRRWPGDPTAEVSVLGTKTDAGALV
jgi:hypothetical protein